MFGLTVFIGAWVVGTTLLYWVVRVAAWIRRRGRPLCPECQGTGHVLTDTERLKPVDRDSPSGASGQRHGRQELAERIVFDSDPAAAAPVTEDRVPDDLSGLTGLDDGKEP